jgi:predicted metal-dependent hydrolase
VTRDKGPKGGGKEPHFQEAISRDLLLAEVWAWARWIGVADRLREVHIRPMKRKWGSVSPHGRLTLNVDLLAQPPNLRREVIVHELVHLKLNRGTHGRLFRALVKAYLAQGSPESPA